MNLETARQIIVDSARSMGAPLTPEAVEGIAARTAAMCERRDDRLVFKAHDDGRTDVNAAAWVTNLIHASALGTIASTSLAPEYAKRKEIARVAKQDGKVKMALEAVSAGNPWDPFTLNRTSQALISLYLPDQAAKMKAEASK
ncbi:hypothetical protein [Heyndrickxia sporothermodurans]